MKSSQIFFVFLAQILILIGSVCQALSIKNKSPYSSLVIIKNQDFSIVTKIKVNPKSTFDYKIEGPAKALYNVESYESDPTDILHTPTFHHLVKPNEKICVPARLCADEEPK